jgi:hypothetical protein
MPDEKRTPNVIPFSKQDGKTIKQALWETYYAIYALTFATELDGVEMEDSEVAEIEDELQRDLILTMKEIRGYSEKASFALFELLKKHQLDSPRRWFRALALKRTCWTSWCSNTTCRRWRGVSTSSFRSTMHSPLGADVTLGRTLALVT